ncbi:unnamed protein product [Protopolystoma xenopodis]|uniref:Uncharacterized protein n=1 Tax=Protopolystoma xenopodis TaxID=117903 RepID=A0A3S5AEU8_9PLAT|nr:unnamed protein product [Protopolystoma xenopodis]
MLIGRSAKKSNRRNCKAVLWQTCQTCSTFNASCGNASPPRPQRILRRNSRGSRPRSISSAYLLEGYPPNSKPSDAVAV